jgi:co-chaperonin GroES (HSP10)
MKKKTVGCAPNKIILRVYVEKDSGLYEENKSGIIEKKDEKKLLSRGTVLAVGTSIDWVKIGDLISHIPHAGTVFGSQNFNNEGLTEALCSLREDEILELVREEEV